MTGRPVDGAPPVNDSADEGRPDSSSQVARSMSYMAVGQVAGQISWFGSLIILGILLDPRAFGTVAAGLVLINAALPLLGAGTSGTLVSTRNLAPGQIWSSIRLNLLIASALVFVLVGFAGPIVGLVAEGGDPSVLRWLSLAVVFHALTITPMALLKKTMRFGKHTLADVGAYTGAGVLAVATALAGGGVWALVVRLVLYQALLASIAIFFSRRMLAPSGVAELEAEEGDARRGGGWFLLLAVTQFAASNADYVVVGRLEGAEQLGLYSLGFTLAFAPLRQFSWQVGRVLFAASAATEEGDRLRRQATTSLRLGGAMLLPFVVPAVLIAPALLPAVLGDKWEPMVPAFQILVVAGIVHAVSNLTAEFLSGTGHVDLRAKLSAAWAIGMIAILIVLVPRYGIVGGAISHVVAAVPLAIAILVLGADRLAMTRRSLFAALVPTTWAVLAQVIAGFAVIAAGSAIGLGSTAVSILATIAALAAGAGALSVGARPPLPEVVSMMATAARGRRGAVR